MPDAYADPMTHVFDPAVREAVLHHMNDDHRDDNLLITRAFSPHTGIEAAEMTDFDGAAGRWLVHLADGSSHEVLVPWPGGEIDERPQVRREIVALYDAACERLGVQPRPHA